MSGSTSQDLPGKDVLTSQLANPNNNPNQPSSYQPSPAVSAVAPVITQITGGNAGNTVAGVQGAQAAEHGLFTDIGNAISKITAPISAAFNAVQSMTGATGNPQTIATQADQLAKAQGQATYQAGVAGANVAYDTAQQQANAAKATADRALAMKLNSNSPESVETMNNITEGARQVQEHSANVLAMNKVGFFDNPAEYLINHLIKIPHEQKLGDIAATELGKDAQVVSDQTKSLQNMSVADTALNSIYTNTRATETAKQALATALAAGIQPLRDAQQTEIGAYRLGVEQGQLKVSQGQLAVSQGQLAVSQANEAVNAQRLALEKQEQPYKLDVLKKQSDYYGAYHDAIIGQLTEKAQLEHEQRLDKIKKDSQETQVLGEINGTIRSLGGQGTLTDLNRLNQEQLKPLSQITSNLNNFGSIGQTPARAFELLKQSGIPISNMPASHQATVDHLGQLYSQGVSAGNSIDIRTGKPKASPAEMPSFVDSYVSQAIRQEQDNVTPNGRFLALPSAETLFKSPWAANNPIVQAIRPATVDGNGNAIHKELDGNLLLNTAADLVRRGKLTDTQAATALQDFAANVTNDEQKTYGFKRFGIPLPEKFGLSYTRSGVGLGDRNSHVDLRNSADTLAAVKRQAAGISASDILKEGIQAITPGSPGDVMRFLLGGRNPSKNNQGVAPQ